MIIVITKYGVISWITISVEWEEEYFSSRQQVTVLTNHHSRLTVSGHPLFLGVVLIKKRKITFSSHTHLLSKNVCVWAQTYVSLVRYWIYSVTHQKAISQNIHTLHPATCLHPHNLQSCFPFVLSLCHRSAAPLKKYSAILWRASGCWLPWFRRVLLK